MGQFFITCPEIVRSRGFELAMRGCELIAGCRGFIERLRTIHRTSTHRSSTRRSSPAG